MLRRIGLVVCLCFSMVAVVNAKDTLAEDILVYINQFRVRQGLPKLKMNPILNAEATRHSADMAAHRVAFGHDGFEHRMQDLHTKIQNAQGGAENVAYNYQNAKIVAEGWIKSPGHRRNILGQYNQTGIGIVRDKLGRPYYTQLFLKSLG